MARLQFCRKRFARWIQLPAYMSSLRRRRERKSREESFKALPERNKFVQFAGVHREQGVVVDARFTDARQLGQKETKGHDISPGRLA